MASPSQRPFDDPAVAAARLLMRVGLVVLAFAAPASLVISRRAIFTLLPVGAGLLLVAATLLPRPAIRDRLTMGLGTLLGIGGLWLLAWSGLSIVWTPFPSDASIRLLKECATVLLVVATAIALPERTLTSNLYLFPLGLVLAAIATVVAAVLGPQAIGAFQDADSTLERAVLGLVMMVWPAIAALAVRDRWTSAGWLAVGVTLAAMAAWTSIALVALAFGAIAFAAATLSPSRVGVVLGIVLAALILLAPALPLVFDPVVAGLADALADRLPAMTEASQSVHVWAMLVASEPLRLVTGHGLDMATRAIQIGYLPLATPRSLLFEVWYELGIVGAASSAALVAGGCIAAGRSSPIVAPFLLAEIMTGMVISIWGLDSTQLWWITLLSVAAIAFATATHGQYRTSRPSAQVAARLIEPPLH